MPEQQAKLFQESHHFGSTKVMLLLFKVWEMVSPEKWNFQSIDLVDVGKKKLYKKSEEICLDDKVNIHNGSISSGNKLDTHSRLTWIYQRVCWKKALKTLTGRWKLVADHRHIFFWTHYIYLAKIAEGEWWWWGRRWWRRWWWREKLEFN